MIHREIPEFKIKQTLKQNRNWYLVRAVRNKDKLPVLIRISRGQSSEPQQAELLESELFKLSDLSLPGILKVHDLIVDLDYVALVQEDPGGNLLNDLLASGSLDLSDFLNIAIQLTSNIAQFHKLGIVHTKLQPDLVLISEDRQSVWISEFEHALKLNGSKPVRNTQLEDNLVYIAPEQTGRIKAEIDYRTDLYSLGVMLYEMITGSPPFEADDPLELIHCHLARMPQNPCDIDSTIPQPLSDIIMRLLMKKPDQRYQSAKGIVADLKACQEQYLNTGSISAIKLALHDRAQKFEIPKRLYGRSDELQQLHGAFDRVHQGGSELVLVAGYSGVGKTSLIQEIRESVVAGEGYFVSGKYDQLERANPYSAILQTFSELVKQILTETDDEIENWKQRLLSALGNNAQVIVEVIPELELIIGGQPALPKLKPQESQNRFNFYFQKFLIALASVKHPLVLFLDDLQWASAASIRLFQNWVSASKLNGLLMIGAYRDNEVDATHPLRSTIEELKQVGVALLEIDLQPLNIESVNNIVQDALGRSTDDSLSLADCVHHKTEGNPFFARAFLRSLYEDGHLKFDDEAGWNWDTETIQTTPAADNVVELMAQKIQRLEDEPQDVIKLAACLGNRFKLNTLATAYGKNTRATLLQLQQVISVGLIEQQDEEFFKFYHDRIQEAAYGLIPKPRREQIHYQIGSLLFSGSSETNLDEQLFEIVNHLNIGSALIKKADEKIQLAELNLRSGKKAKTSTAYSTAHDYFSSGVKHLPSNPWNKHYSLTFELYREQSECAYLCGNFDQAEAGFKLLMKKAQTRLEKATIFNLRIIQFENMSQFPQAVKLGLEALNLFDIHFPENEPEKLKLVDEEIEAIQQQLDGRKVSELVQLPVMQDAEKRICMKLLMTMWAPNYISGDITMTMLIAACMVRLSLQYGNTEESAYGYVTHAINLAARTGDHALAYEYGLLALNVNRELDDRTARAKVNHMFSCYICLWRDHIKECFTYSRAGYEAGIESGDFTYGGYSGFHESWHAIFSGMDLEKYDKDYSVKLEFLSGYQYQSIGEAHQLMLQWGRCLQGKTDSPLSLDGQGFSEQSYLESYQDAPFFMAFYYVVKLNTSYLMHDFQAAMHYAQLAEKVIFGVRGMIWDALLCFNQALTLTAVFDTFGSSDKKSVLAKLKLLRRQMSVWADNAPQNFAHQYDLIRAEILRIEGKHYKASQYYESAIESARIHGFVNMEALAGELAGRCLLQIDRHSIADAYLQDAAGRYRFWGANAIVRKMAEIYGSPDVNLESQTYSERVRLPELDIAAILKASQAISGEMIMHRLIERLMRIVLENAGAERGWLLCPEGEKWRVDARGTVESDGISIDLSSADHRQQEWSCGVVSYVSRTGEYLLSADAQQDHRLTGDHHTQDNNVISVLCVPIKHQQKVIAILYLENNLMPNTFSEDRVQVVQALAAQAAIALENARLYSDVIKENIERRQAESALRVISSGTASVTGQDFFKSLVKSLADSLKIKTVFVAECIEGDNLRVRSLAYMKDGEFKDNIEFELAGTPCEGVVDGKVCYHPENLEKLYPKEKGKGYESYLGAPAIDQSGQVLGHLALFDTTDMRHLPHAESILRIFATRVGVELQRKRTQQALQASEEKYRLLVENQTDLVVKLDREGHLLFASPSYTEMFCPDGSDLQGCLFFDQVYSDDIERVRLEWNKLFVKPWITQFEHRAISDSGERWLGWALKSLRDSQGEIIEIVGVGRDITERRKAEEQSRHNLQTMAHAGRVQSMGEMASSLAHELNQPLTAILSFSQASQRIVGSGSFEQEELLHALDRIAVNAQRAGDIISHMRSFVRKEDSSAELSDMNQLISEAMDLVSSELLKLKIELVIDQQEPIPMVPVDTIQIQQVVLNLVRNSMEAIDQHGSKKRNITIITRMYKPGSIEVTVSDTGPGLDKEISNKVFSTFVTTKADGMGVGLSICKSIVEAHDGELCMRKRPGGATFSFILPSESKNTEL